jgi:hypothetical protein
LALTLLLSAAISVLWAQPSAPADSAIAGVQAPAACEIAARCEVVVAVACPAGTICALEPPGRLEGFEVLQVAEAPAPSGSRAWCLTLIAFEPGSVTVPPVAVRVVRDRDGATSIAFTPVATIDVRMPPGEEDDELRDAAAPIDPGPDWRVVTAWAAGLVVALALLTLGRRFWMRPRPTRARAAAVLTLDQVVDRIRALEGAPVASPEEALALYRRLSDVLRSFASFALDVPAEALTSHELVQVIRATPHATTIAPKGRALLEGIDRVKFGGERPVATARAAAIASAVDLVRAVARPRVAGKVGERGGADVA